MLAYWGKKRKLIKILRLTETGAVAQYEPVDEPGMIFAPLIENGKNVEEFEIIKNEQLSLFDMEG